MKEFTIGINDAGQRLDKFLQKTTVHLPSSLMYKMIRKKRIKINGKRCGASTVLQLSDHVACYINDEFFSDQPDLAFLSSKLELDIVYEDANILLLNKPVGLDVHQSENAATDNLIDQVKHYLYQKKEYLPEKENGFSPALCNRIDRNTQGIVIAAKTAEALRIINRKIKEREIEKYYLCLVEGVPTPEHHVLLHYWKKDSNHRKAQISNTPLPGTKEIKTEYTVMRSSHQRSLLEVRLHTGRFHQIRADMAFIGHPLVGDRKYGGSGDEKYQLLSAYKLKFDFRTDAGPLNYLNGKTVQLHHVWFESMIEK